MKIWHLNSVVGSLTWACLFKSALLVEEFVVSMLVTTVLIESMVVVVVVVQPSEAGASSILTSLFKVATICSAYLASCTKVCLCKPNRTKSSKQHRRTHTLRSSVINDHLALIVW